MRLLAAEVGRVYAYVNKWASPAVLCALSEIEARVIHSDINFGVGEALNTLALAAALDGFERLLLMDQDSRLDPGSIATLSDAMDDLVAEGVACAAVGPQPVPATDMHKAPRYFDDPRTKPRPVGRAVRYLITSGTLLDLRAFLSVGAFRSDFFIDAIDVEWCFRAGAKGYSCWCIGSVQMQHPVGDGAVSPRMLGGPFPLQRSFRYFAVFRNNAYCLRLAHIPISWRIRVAMHLLRLGLVLGLTGERSLGLGACFFPALWAGFRGRLGPPRGAAGAIEFVPATVVGHARVATSSAETTS